MDLVAAFTGSEKLCELSSFIIRVFLFQNISGFIGIPYDVKKSHLTHSFNI